MEDLLWGLGAVGVMLLMFVVYPCWLAKATEYKPNKKKADNVDGQ